MKKVLTVTTSLLLILLSAISVSAAKDPNATFTIDELGITMYIPMHYVATRTSNNFDMEPEKFEEVVKDFEQHDIYLWGGSKFYNEEIYLHAKDTNVKSLAHFNEEGLKDVADNIKENLKANGCIISKNEIYESYNATYILTHYHDTEDNYAISYSTVENYKYIVLTMWCYSFEPTATQRKDFLSIINTVEFDTDTQGGETAPTETKQEDDSFPIYSNTVIFHLAENGKLTPLGESLIATAVVVLINLISGAIVAIILVTKAKKRKKTALAQPSQFDNKFCIYCGVQLNANDSSCYKCGKSQTISPADTENTNNN